MTQSDTVSTRTSWRPNINCHPNRYFSRGLSFSVHIKLRWTSKSSIKTCKSGYQPLYLSIRNERCLTTIGAVSAWTYFICEQFCPKYQHPKGYLGQIGSKDYHKIKISAHF